jgi:hypothetical protein
MPDRLPSILGHQGFELIFRPLMVEKGLASVAEQGGEFGPGIRRAHVDDADRVDARPRFVANLFLSVVARRHSSNLQQLFGWFVSLRNFECQHGY